MRSLPRLKTLLCAAGALGLATTAACGDDSGSDPDARPSADGRTIDADVPDSAPPDASISDLRSGVIAVIDATVTNDFSGIGIPGLSGPSISISFTDLTTATTAPVFGEPTPPLGGCNVFVYDSEASPPTAPPETVDEGPVSFTVANTDVVLPPCTFVNGSYRCIAAAGPATGTVQTNQATQGVEFPGAAFTDDHVGMWLNLTGMPDEGANGTFQILTRNSATNVTVAQPIANSQSEDGTTPTYSVIQGLAPGPVPQVFLSKDTEVTAAKAEGDIVPALTGNTLTPSGAADPDAVPPVLEFSLDDSETLPHTFPTTVPTEDIVYSCAAPASCGVAGTGSAAVGFTIAGTATNADLTGALPYEMPQGTKTAAFQCRGSVGGSSITMPKEAVEAILGIGATRVETRVLRVTADLSAGATHGTSVVVGKGLVGWTNIPQAN